MTISFRSVLLLAAAFSILAIGAKAQNDLASIRHRMDSLQKVKGNTPYSAKDTLLIMLKWSAAKALISENKMEEAKKELNEALQIAGNINDQAAVAETYVEFASFEKANGHTKETENDYLKAIALLEKYGSKKHLGRSLVNLGLFYYSGSNYPQALQMFSRADSIFTELKDRQGIAFTVFNTGLINDDLGNYDRAWANYQEAQALFQELNDQAGLAKCYVNMGLVLQNKKEDQKAIDNYAKAIAILNTIDDPIDLAVVLNNYGYLLLVMKQADSAISYLRHSEKIAEQMDNMQFLLNIRINIAEYFSLKGRQDSAETYVRAVLDFAEKANDRYLKKESYRVMAIVYSAKRDFEKACFYKDKLVQINDSINNDERVEKFNRLQMQFDFDKQNAAAKSEQERIELIAKEDASRQKLYLNFVIICLLLVVVIAAFIFRSYVLKKRANIEIVKQKEMVEHKQKEILDSIHYAKRIQRSLLPTDRKIDNDLKRLKKQ
jgi:tetratricopeptide (TPR) repeat protein